MRQLAKVASPENMLGEYRDIHKNSTIAAEVVAYIAAEVVIAIMCIFSNLLVLVAIFRFKSLQTSTYWLIASLAVADIGVGLIGIPSAILLRIGLVIASNATTNNGPDQHAVVDSGLCFVIVSSVLFLTQVSIFSLLIIAVDRFIAIYYALRYRSIVNSFRVKIGITLAWCFGAIIGFAPQLGWMHDTPTYHNTSGAVVKHCYFTEIISMQYMVYFNFFVCVLLPLTIMLILYALIFRSAKQQLKKIYAVIPRSSKFGSKNSSSTSLASGIISFSVKLKNLTTSNRTVCDSQYSITHGQDADSITFSASKNTFTKCATVPLMGNNKKTGTFKDGYICQNCLQKRSIQPISKSVEDLVKETKQNDNMRRSSSLNFDCRMTISPTTDTSLCQDTSSKTKCSICKTSLTRFHPSFKRFLGSFFYTSTRDSTVSNCLFVNKLNSDKKQLLRRKSKLLRKEFKAARSLFTVIIVFALCWLPLHIYNTVCLLYPNCQYRAWLTDCTILLTHLNSTLNPIIYSYQLGEVKLAFQKILKPFWKRIKLLFCCGKDNNHLDKSVS